jgi:hypothetical protein
MSSAEIAAALRHVATFFAGFLTMLGVTHFLSAEAAAQFGQGLGKIADGVGDVLVVAGPVVAGVSAYFSRRSATPSKQADALIDSGQAHKIIGTPELAESTNSPRVVTQGSE